MEVNRLLGQARRLLDAAAVQVASEVARQSRPELGADSLAKQQGHRNATTMLATTLATSTTEAARLVQVGEATAPRLLLTGEQAPARHPHVGAAVHEGRIGRDAAAAIIEKLDDLAARVSFEALDEAERILTEQAVGLDLAGLRKLLLRVEARLDPDGVEPKEEDLRARTFLSIRQDASGGIVLKAFYDPARGAVLVSLIDAMVTADLGAQRDKATKGNGLPPRPIPEMQAEALITDLDNGCLLCDLCHHHVHDYGWEIRIDGAGIHAAVWLIPPAHVDPSRTPRPAARARLDYRAAA